MTCHFSAIASSKVVCKFYALTMSTLAVASSFFCVNKNTSLKCFYGDRRVTTLASTKMVLLNIFSPKNLKINEQLKQTSTPANYKAFKEGLCISVRPIRNFAQIKEYATIIVI